MTAADARRRRPVAKTRESGGLDERRVAVEAIAEVLARRAPLDETLDDLARKAGLDPRDEALARAIAAVAFRRYGTLREAIRARLDRGLPKDPSLLALLLAGAAQVLFLDVPDHAAVDTAVRIARSDPRLAHAAGLVNALLRRIGREREDILNGVDAWRDTPDWLKRRWLAAFGEEAAAAVAGAHGLPANVDLTIPHDPAGWAERLGGILLPTGSVRLTERTPIRDLAGFDEGAWWVQDAGAALPARLIGARPGERVADLCAAPGGKTAQLAAAGAQVLAIDRSAKRLARVEENLRRLRLSAETRAVDALDLADEPFDAVLLDAPCSATGTIRRHPDVAWAKRPGDIGPLAALQGRLLDKATRLVRPGGRLVYCTCSLEPEEGEAQAESFLDRHPDFARVPVAAEEIGGLAEALSPAGDLRTLPSHLRRDTPEHSGLDGFYAARFVRAA